MRTVVLLLVASLALAGCAKTNPPTTSSTTTSTPETSTTTSSSTTSTTTSSTPPTNTTTSSTPPVTTTPPPPTPKQVYNKTVNFTATPVPQATSENFDVAGNYSKLNLTITFKTTTSGTPIGGLTSSVDAKFSDPDGKVVLDCTEGTCAMDVAPFAVGSWKATWNGAGTSEVHLVATLQP